MPDSKDKKDKISHEERMRGKKAVVDARIEKANLDKGLILVHTGNGKGKSSAGFGMVARALGHGIHVGVVQFIKGPSSTGEENFFRRFPEDVEYHVMGEGFTWETQNKERDIQTAQKAWLQAKTMLENDKYQLVLLDELNIVLKCNYLDVQEVLAALQNKPKKQHVVITGRAAKPELMAIADTVTEMRAVKHAFDAGIRAQAGIEY